MKQEIAKNVSGVYLIQCLANGKNYIGSAKCIRSRWRKHVNDLNKKIHHSIKLQEDWIKYSEDQFKFEVLLECSHADSKKYEMEYIQKFNSDKFGYNMKDFKDGISRRRQLTERLLLEYAINNGYKSDGNSYWFDLFDVASELNIPPTKLLDFCGLNVSKSWTIFTPMVDDEEILYGICWDSYDAVQFVVSHESFSTNPESEQIKCF